MRAALSKWVHERFARVGFDLIRRPSALLCHPERWLTLKFEYVLAHYLMNRDGPPTFVQIGAYDGKSNDPIYAYATRGLLRGCLLEPQPGPFQRLENNYANVPGVTLKRAAIHHTTGQAQMFRVKPGTPGPAWLEQLATFRRESILRHDHIVPNIAEAIITEQVPTITFDDLVAQTGYEPDIVCIDTEGFDYEVLKLMDVRRRQPSIVYYESNHLNTADKNAAVRLLIGAGYRVADLGNDTLAYRDSPAA